MTRQEWKLAYWAARRPDLYDRNRLPVREAFNLCCAKAVLQSRRRDESVGYRTQSVLACESDPSDWLN